MHNVNQVQKNNKYLLMSNYYYFCFYIEYFNDFLNQNQYQIVVDFSNTKMVKLVPKKMAKRRNMKLTIKVDLQIKKKIALKRQKSGNTDLYFVLLV